MNIRTFFKASDGAAAIEFAFIAPVFATLALLMVDVSNIGMGASNMQTAVRAAVQYAVKGGTNMTTAQNLANANWANKPTGATLTAVASCRCGNATNVCNALCPDGSVPYSYVTVTAAATLGGNWITTSKTVMEEVRLK
jgi:Flp pilus assembly protein TadG